MITLQPTRPLGTRATPIPSLARAYLVLYAPLSRLGLAPRAAGGGAQFRIRFHFPGTGGAAARTWGWVPLRSGSWVARPRGFFNYFSIANWCVGCAQAAARPIQIPPHKWTRTFVPAIFYSTGGRRAKTPAPRPRARRLLRRSGNGRGRANGHFPLASPGR